VLDNNHVGENSMNNVSVGAPEWKRSFGIPKQKRENNSKAILKK